LASPHIIVPEGELDLASLDGFRRELAAIILIATAELVIDLSYVSFIDSSGLAAVIEAHESLAGDGRELAVIAPRGTAASQILTLTGLRQRLSVFESRSAALAGLQQRLAVARPRPAG
jgi:anti-sigma B factor antagonist